MTLMSLDKAYFSFFVPPLVVNFPIDHGTLETFDIITRLVPCTQEYFLIPHFHEQRNG